MNTYLISYFNRAKTFGGYAIVVGSSAREANTILSNQGRYIDEGYLIVSTRDIGFHTEEVTNNRILLEGVSPDGMSAYDLAVRAGFKGTLQQWLDSLKASGGGSGHTPKFQIGGTVTLPAGSEASVSIADIGKDTAGNPIYQLNFGIPKGQDFAFDKLTPEDTEELVTLIEDKVVLKETLGKPGGVATLDENGKIPSSQITAGSTGAATTETVDVSKTIQVTGGPLASALNTAGIDTLNKDMSMQELLELLFTDEKYPEPIYTQGKLTSIIAAPVISISSNPQEIGTSLTIPTYKVGSINYVATPSEVKGLTYGYSKDKVQKNSSTSITSNIQNIQTVGQYTFTRTLNGVETTVTGGASISIPSTTITIQSGTNTIKNVVTGPAITGSFEKLPAVWYYSNLGNLRDDKITQEIEATTVTASAPKNTTTVSILGLYPIYANTENLDTLTKQAISSAKEYTITLVSSDKASGKLQSFAVATDDTISKLEVLNTLSNTWETYDLSRFTLTNTTLKSGNVDTLYTVYTRNEYVGETTFKITIL